MGDNIMHSECMEFVGEEFFTDTEKEFLWELGAQKDDGLENWTDSQREELKEIYENMRKARDAYEGCDKRPDSGPPDMPKGFPPPKIVCLCGSTSFSAAFRQANFDETLAGRIVLTIGCDVRGDGELFGSLSSSEIVEIKRRLDELHLRKIDLADEILVINVHRYIGESTRSEILYAQSQEKPIRFLEEPVGLAEEGGKFK